MLSLTDSWLFLFPLPLHRVGYPAIFSHSIKSHRLNGIHHLDIQNSPTIYFFDAGQRAGGEGGVRQGASLVDNRSTAIIPPVSLLPSPKVDSAKEKLKRERKRNLDFTTNEKM